MDKIKSIIIEVEKFKENWHWKKAEELIEQSIIKYSNDYKLFEELADISIYSWKLDKAEKAIDFALEINPKSATWNYLKWFLLLSTDNTKNALKFLEKSNSLIWNNSEVLRNLWWAYTMNWQVEKWITILKRALNLSPWDKLITEDLAMALIWKGEIEKGNTILKKINK
jgi:tetratricopeptide (TPR) repeat protein